MYLCGMVIVNGHAEEEVCRRIQTKRMYVPMQRLISLSELMPSPVP